ncbi:MAG: xanthine dehydrogenase family protein molybdopterin-binding subunit [Candidatus Latescibacterota bacterium]|nr:xanthine dehydrogenase family protein molybdopterin-binding subunit [Candidatus Latescibacterota bacterium]
MSANQGGEIRSFGKDDYKVVGTRPIRHDGTDKVTGRAIYGGDTRLAGMLYGQVLRSPHAHARVKSVDTSKAEALDGVKAVVTGGDLPVTSADEIVDLGEGPARIKHLRDNVLATDKVLYRGHPVAAVAATSLHIADDALDLIEVDYEVLPPVLDVLEAMKDDAPLLHDSITMQDLGEDTGKKSNIASRSLHELGNIEEGFSKAQVVAETKVSTATVHQGYIEPHNGTAVWNADGHITIWSSTQGSFTLQKQVAAVLGVPISKVRVIPQEIGGGFGGKIPTYLEPTAALLSRQSGHPVKLIMTRADVFESTGPTPGSYIKVRMGADSDGNLVAADAYIAFESGGYPGCPVGAAAMCVFACYDIPNARVEFFDVVVNKPRSFAYRAPGSTQVAFATEKVMDELAEKLGKDRLDLRLQNTAAEGMRRSDGLVYPRIGCKETLEAMRHHDHYKAPLAGSNSGRGVAVGYWFNVGLKSAVTASVNNDGTVQLVEGSTDIGGSRTSIAMQFAEALGLAAEDVNPMVGDTSTIGYTDVTGGSRVTYATGWAAYEAAQDVKRQMIERAAKVWEVGQDQVEFEDGTFRTTHNSKSMTFKELAGRIGDTGGPVVGRATVDPASGVGGSFAGNIVDVEVDSETGKVEILRFTVFQDAGKAIHPSYVEGQMQGGSVQGIGWALNEEYFYGDDGVMANSSLLDYRVPTALDLPMIDTVIIEVPNPGHPYGVRGVGEANIAPPPAAIASAINDAVGLQLCELPMKPDRVVAAVGQDALAVGGGS